MDTVGIREERANETNVLDLVRCDGRAGAGTSSGSGNSSASGGDYYGDRGMREFSPDLSPL